MEHDNAGNQPGICVARLSSGKNLLPATRKNLALRKPDSEGPSRLVWTEGPEHPTFTMSKSSSGRPPLSSNVQERLYNRFFGSYKFPPTSAKIRHFPCHRQYIGSTNRLEPNGSQPLHALGRWG